MKRFAALMLALLMLCTMQCAFAREESDPTMVIRVGYPTQFGLTDVDENGHYSGYTYEYLAELAQFTGWTYEFVTVEGDLNTQLTMLMNMLSKGEIDLLGGMVRNEALEGMFQYPERSYGTGYTALVADVANTALNEVTFPTYAKQGIRVGAPEGGTKRKQQLAAYCTMNDYKYELVTYASTEELLRLFAEDKIDVSLGSDLSCPDDTDVVAYFAGEPFYFVSTLGNTAVTDALDMGATQLEAAKPTLQMELHQKYFFNKETGFFLTDEEKAYAEAAPVIRVLCAGENPPYQKRSANGGYEGISIQILNKLSKQSGLRFEYVDYDPNTPLKEQITKQRVQLVMGARCDYAYAYANGLVLGNPIVQTQVTLFALRTPESSDFSGQRLALLKDTEPMDLFEGATIVYGDSVSDCMSLVENGQADIGYGNAYSVSYYFSNHASTRLTTMQIPGETLGVGFAFATPADTQLITMVNRMVDSTTDTEVYSWMMSEISTEQSPVTLRQLIELHPQLAIAGCVLLLLIAFAVVMIVTNSRNKQKLYAGRLKAESTFLARMSHEIRTPLNAVIGYLSIARSEPNVPDKVQHCLENGELAAKHLLSIINDVLDMSAIESGRIKIGSEDYNFKQQLSTISTIFYSQAKSRDVQFEVHIEKLTEEWVVGDQLRVNQVLMNLLSNAVKFTPAEGHVSLRVQQLEKTDANVRFRFTVSDTGAGMSQAFLSRMFTPFEQESAKTAQKYGGTGLGLAISKNLVGLMGGTIDCQSEQGKGTTFTVELTFGVSAENAKEHHATTDYAKIHALIVDDEQDECDYVKQLLERFGVKCTVVTSGKEAVRKIRGRMNTDFAYDLCLMDWNMPECDGVETARIIHERCDQAIPIIIITAYDVTEVETEARSAGVHRVIAKPLFQSTLSDLLVSTFGKYKPEVVRGTSDIDLTGLHLLLAEDNAMNTEIAVEILKKLGVTVDVAEDGKRAVEMFTGSAKGTYAGILMDIQMPVMDGYEATKAIRASGHEEARSIPIIAMTANAFNEDVAAALASGMNDHVAKPIEFDKLMRVLKKHCQGEGENKIK